MSRIKDKRLCIYLPNHIYEWLQKKSLKERRGWITEHIIGLLDAEMQQDPDAVMPDPIQLRIDEITAEMHAVKEAEQVRKEHARAQATAQKEKAEGYIDQAKADPGNALDLALRAYKLGIGLKRLKVELPEIYPDLREMVRRLRI